MKTLADVEAAFEAGGFYNFSIYRRPQSMDGKWVVWTAFTPGTDAKMGFGEGDTIAEALAAALSGAPKKKKPAAKPAEDGIEGLFG